MILTYGTVLHSWQAGILDRASPRIYVLLRREGLQENHKRVERIYRNEELSLRRKRKKRIRSEEREKPESPTRPNQQWSMDFMSDSIAGGRRFRTLNIIDAYTRECLALEVDLNIGGLADTRTLERLTNPEGNQNAFSVTMARSS